MNRREKIILGVMAVAVLYGVYALFFAGGGRKTAALATPDGPSLQTIVTQAAAKISAADHRKRDALLLKAAAAELSRNPFPRPQADAAALERARIEKAKQAQAILRALAGRFVYSGYLAMGTHRFAVINGIEYTVGDAIPPEGDVLRQIGPDAVVIGDPKSGEAVRIELQDNQ